MNVRQLFAPLIPLLFTALAAGCASFPDEIAVEDADSLPTFGDVQNNPDEFKGRQMVLGGMIVSVRNDKDHSTLEVLQLPLYSSGRPQPTDKAGGRFRVVFDEFLDPEVYSNGKMVSVRGVLTGTESGKIGEHPYTFLMLKGDGHYLWRDQPDEVQVRYYMGINTYYPYYPVYVRPVRPAPRH